jgi:hypothetical protein
MSYYDMLQVAPRTGREKVRVFYARDEDWNPVILKGPLSTNEIEAMLETERIKQILKVPRTHVRRDNDFLVSNCLYDYDYEDSHICLSPIDNGERLSNIKLKMWKHDFEGKTLERSFLKALALRLILGTDDTVPRNFVVLDETVYSVDDPAWKKEPTQIWKIKNHTKKYTDMLDRHWEWVQAFLKDWQKQKSIGHFSIRMCNKYLKRENWSF